MKHLIQRGRVIKSLAVLVHAEHGEGKTTFGAKTPNPIIIRGEDMDEVAEDKFPKCVSWEDFIEQLTWVRDNDDEHNTLVIDTLDSIESLLHKHILETDSNEKATMATARGGFGKAYDEAAEKMLKIRDNYLDPIRNSGKNVLLLCHTMRYRVEDPNLQISYERFEPKLHSKRNGMGVRSVFTEWVSIIGFGAMEKVKSIDSAGKERLFSDGTRLLYCRPKPHIAAKNRFDLPDSIPLSWQALKKNVDDFYSKNENPEVKEIKNELRELVVQINDEELKNTTIENIKGAGDDLKRLKAAVGFVQGHLRSQEKGEENE